MDETLPKATVSKDVAVLAVGLLLVSLVPPLALSGPAAADGVAQFSFAPSTVDVHPGGTFSVELNLQSTPQLASGVTEAGVVVTFNGSHLDVTDIERGPFMNLREETTVRTNTSTIDNEEGYLVYELVRDPPRGGTHGFATFATITFRVSGDAPSDTFDVQVWQTRILLTDGMYQQTFPATATVRVTDAPSETAEPGATTSSRSERAITGRNDSEAPSADSSDEDTKTPVAEGDRSAGTGGSPGAGTLQTILLVVVAIGLFGVALLLMRRYLPTTSSLAPTKARTAGHHPPRTCPECGKEFGDEQAVRDHAWDVHDVCHHCGASFDSREQLYDHWLAAHEARLSRLDRRKARRSTGSRSGGNLIPFDPVAAVSGRDKRLVILSVVGIAMLCLVFATGYFMGGSVASSLPGGSTDDPGIGTPSGPLGPEGYNVSRQSTVPIGEQGSVHWHATLTVTITGERVGFGRPSYMLRSKYVHFEGGDGNTVHKHATGVTLTDLFFTIDWWLTDRCLITPDGSRYCSGDSGVLEIVVNGGEIDAPEEYEIRDGDRIHIRYDRTG